MKLTIEPYRSENAAEWNAAVAAARNGTFQHLRGYMDYHSDRFADASLIARDDRGNIVALLPAHAYDHTIASHRGLSYAGWLMTPRIDMLAMMDLWQQFIDRCRTEGFKELIYKPSPHIYHKYPGEEDLYALWRSGATLSSRLVSTAAPLKSAMPFDMSCRQSVRKAQKSGVTVQRCNDYASFWAMLNTRLDERYGATPVHTLDEIELLHSRFPDNIRLYTATLGDELLAGIVMYVSDTVGHSQYTASTEQGRNMRVIPLIYSQIIADLSADGVLWIDYGTSNENGGTILNEGLIRQKIGFGARAICFDTYHLTL